MRYHQALGHRSKHWELIQNGFDLTRFRPDTGIRSAARARLGLSDDQVAVGMLARFDPQKDHATFISAAARLHAERPKTVFVLAGTGMTEANREVMAQLQQCGLMQSTRLLGELADPAQLLPGLDIHTLSSAFGEGFPNALGEAMSCGVPCVATDVGDSALLLGDTGKVVSPRAPAELAAAWAELVALEPRDRQRIGANARERIAQRFSLPIIVAAYEALYARGLDRKDSRSQ